jgi:hypothetical protein
MIDDLSLKTGHFPLNKTSENCMRLTQVMLASSIIDPQVSRGDEFHEPGVRGILPVVANDV